MSRKAKSNVTQGKQNISAIDRVLGCRREGGRSTNVPRVHRCSLHPFKRLLSNIRSASGPTPPENWSLTEYERLLILLTCA